MPKTYGTVTTFTAGSVLTAAQLNTAGTAINNLVVPASCLVRLTSDAGSYTSDSAISWASTAQWDTDGMFSSGTPTTVTIQTTGLYLITLHAYWTATATVTVANANPRLNGTALASGYFGANTGTSGFVSVSVVASCVATDAITAGVGFIGGSAYVIKGSATNQSQLQTRMSVTWIGRTS